MKIFRAVALGALCLISFDAQATLGIFQYGSGIKALGFGGVSYVGVEETTAISANPSSVTGLGDRYDIGTDVLAIKSHSTITGNAAGPDESYPSNARHWFPIPQVGVTQSLANHWSVGATAFAAGFEPDYTSSPYARFASPSQAQSSASATNQLQIIGMSLVTAREWIPGQSFGGAVNVQYQSLKVRGLAPFEALSAAPNDLTDKGTHGAPGIGVTVGWTGVITPWLTGALSYRSTTWAGRIKQYSGLLPDQGRLELPAIFGGAVQFTPAPNWKVGVEFQRYDYAHSHAFGNQINKVFEGYPLGSTNGPGFGWKSQNVYKIGLRYQALPQLALRAGFVYGTQIIPHSQTLFAPLAPATSQIHYTAGLTYTLSTISELSSYAALASTTTVSGENSIPTAFGGGEVGTSFRGVSFGLSYGKRFGKVE